MANLIKNQTKSPTAHLVFVSIAAQALRISFEAVFLCFIPCYSAVSGTVLCIKAQKPWEGIPVPV